MSVFPDKNKLGLFPDLEGFCFSDNPILVFARMQTKLETITKESPPNHICIILAIT